MPEDVPADPSAADSASQAEPQTSQAEPQTEPDSLSWLADPTWVREARSHETDPARLREAMEQFAADLDRRPPRAAGKARGRSAARQGDPAAEDKEHSGDGRGKRGQPGSQRERGPGERGRASERRAAAAGEQDSRDPQEVARDICLRLLAVRPRTRAELAQALRKRRIDKDVAAAVLNRYDEVGMIDDAAFAKAWVTSRHHGRGLAGRALAQELRQRGVSKEDTDEALSELDPETEAQTALDLATRKLRSMHGEPEAIFRRLAGMLARKGYPPGVALRAVKEALATRDGEAGAEGWGVGGWGDEVELIDPDAYEE